MYMPQLGLEMVVADFNFGLILPQNGVDAEFQVRICT